jgi:hypothetical protein
LLRVRAKAGQRLVIPSHAAIGAILATKIRDLHDGTDENPIAELLSGRGGGPIMQLPLRLAAQGQV